MEVKQTGIKSKRKQSLFIDIYSSILFLFFCKKTYLATLLHIRPPQCLSAFQQRQHCQKTQKQAASYRCRSHGNRPAEGVPAPTLICTNSARTPLPGNTLPPPSPWSEGGGGGGLLPEPAIGAERLVVKSATWGGGRIKIPGMMGLRCSFAQLPPLNKEHTFPAAGAAPGPTELQFKASWSRRRAGRDVNSRSLTGKTINK